MLFRSLAWPLFELAQAEGRFLIDQCEPENEEVFCELGQVHYCMARRLVTQLGVREPAARARVLEVLGGGQEDDVEEPAYGRRLGAEILRQLGLARDCFLKGRVISPTGRGNRSFHWCFRVDALLSVLQAKMGHHLAAPVLSAGGSAEGALDRFLDADGRFIDCARRLFVSAGWSLPKPAPDGLGFVFDDGLLLLHVAEAFDAYLATTRCPSYRANILYAFAILVYDFVPDLTVGLLRMALGWLDESGRLAQALARGTTGPGTIITCFSQIQPASALVARTAAIRERLTTRHAAALSGDDEDVLLVDRSHKFLLSSFLDERLVDFEALC